MVPNAAPNQRDADSIPATRSIFIEHFELALLGVARIWPGGILVAGEGEPSPSLLV